MLNALLIALLLLSVSSMPRQAVGAAPPAGFPYSTPASSSSSSSLRFILFPYLCACRVCCEFFIWGIFFCWGRSRIMWFDCENIVFHTFTLPMCHPLISHLVYQCFVCPTFSFALFQTLLPTFWCHFVSTLTVKNAAQTWTIPMKLLTFNFESSLLLGCKMW